MNLDMVFAVLAVMGFSRYDIRNGSGSVLYAVCFQLRDVLSISFDVDAEGNYKYTTAYRLHDGVVRDKGWCEEMCTLGDSLRFAITCVEFGFEEAIKQDHLTMVD